MIFRYLLVLAAVLFSSSLTFAQFKPYKFKENQKQWEDGKLTWDDFQGKPIPQSFTGSDLSYWVLYNPEKQKWSDTTVNYLRAYTIFNKDLSWVLPLAKNRNLLDYNQTLFNTLELHERLLQRKLNRMRSVYDAPELANQALREMQTDIKMVQEATDMGRNEVAVGEWLQLTNQALDSVKVEKLPPFRDSHFGMGMHWGIGHATPAGTLSELFSSHTGLAYGFDFKYKQAILFLDVLLSGGRLKSDFHNKYSWDKNLNTSLFLGNASFGYPVVNNKNWRLTPFLGPAVVEFSPSTSDREFNKQVIDEYTWSYGLNADFKIRKQVTIVPVGFGRESADYGIRTRFSVYPVNYSPVLRGTFYNVSLSFYFNVHFVRITD